MKQILPALIRFLTLVFLVITVPDVNLLAQTTLAPGDIAIIGVNIQGGSRLDMTLVTTTDIASGTVIHISDYGLMENGNFLPLSLTAPTEGALTWTTNTVITRGTVINFSINVTSNTSLSATVSGLPGTVTVQGWTNAGVASPAGDVGDNFFIYQSSAANVPSGFIYAWGNWNNTTVTINNPGGVTQTPGEFFKPGSGDPTPFSSYLPSSLTPGLHAIALNYLKVPNPNFNVDGPGFHGEYNVYTGTNIGTREEVLAAISNTSNWLTSDVAPYDIAPGGQNLPTTFFESSASTNADLSGLTISQGTLTPVFDPGTSSYSATVGNAVNSIEVTPGTADANATVTVNGTLVAGGSPSGAIPLSVGNGNIITVVVTAEDGSTTRTYTVTVTRSTALLATISSYTDVACSGNNSGQATVTVEGGVAPYQYSWSPAGGSSATASGLFAGTYSVTVTDAIGQEAPAQITITEPTVLALTPVSITNASCSGATDGSATVSVDGGSGGYTYSWAPSGGNGATATGLSAGTYTVTVTDSNGCEGSQSFTITAPSPLQVSVSQTDVSCFGGSNGTATVVASGGTPGYSYSWAPNGAMGPTASGLSAGTYFVTVSDANSCSTLMSVTITEPDELTAAVGQTNVSEPGASNGSATVTPSGGMSPYTIAWDTDPVQTTPTISGLPAGTYTATITDANGCEITRQVTLTQPSLSDNATLSALLLSSGTLVPQFSPSVTDYTVTLPNTVETLSFAPVLATSTASLEVNGIPAVSGAPVGPFNLSIGLTTISIDVLAQDGITGQTYTLTVNRSLPVFSGLPASITLQEDARGADAQVNLQGARLEGGSGTYTVRLTASGGYFDIAASGSALIVEGHASGELRLTGTRTEINQYIAIPSNIYFIPPADLNGPAAVQLDLAIKEAAADDNQFVEGGQVDVNLEAVNDAPVWTFPGTQSVGKNETLVFSAGSGNPISVADVDLGAGQMLVTLMVSSGTMTLSGGSSGLSFTQGNGVANTSMAFTGTLTAVNTALAGLTFQPSADFVGQVLLNLSVNDQGNTGAGGPETAEESVSINVVQTAPTVIGVTTTAADGSYKLGDELEIQVVFDQSVVVTGGTPELLLRSRTSNPSFVETVSYTSGSGTNTLVFTYTVQTGNLINRLRYVDEQSLTLGGATVRNSNGEDASLTLPTPGSNQSLSGQHALAIDGRRPTVYLLTTTASGTYLTGDSLLFNAVLDEPVTVDTSDGRPGLNVLLNNGESANAYYYSGSGTSGLRFVYVVSAGEVSQGITVGGTLALNGGSIVDSVGNAVNTLIPTLPLPGIRIDGAVPELSEVELESSNPNPDYAKAGDTVTLRFTSSESIQPLVVQLAGNTVSAVEVSPNRWEASHVMEDSDSEGPVQLYVSYEDLMGNAGTPLSTSPNTVVYDRTAPVVVTQTAEVILNAQGVGNLTVDQVDNGSSDTHTPLTYALSITDFTCNDVGGNTVTLTVTDPAGNTATGTATVTVVDNTAPVVTTQDITVQLDATGEVIITAEQIDNGSTDACGIASLSLSQTDFDCGNVGVNTVTLTVTDVNGNTNTATATVTVEDNTPPVVITQDITVYLDATGEVIITAEQIDDGSTDACGIASLSLSQTDFDCGDVGDNTVTLTVTDINGNTNTATATVTVEDSTAPVVTTQDITVYLDATGSVSITADQLNDGSSDNCAIASISISQTEFDCGDIGANTVTLTVTDINGNTNTATATVTVVDNIAPIINAQDITVYLDATGTASITADELNNGSADVCGIASITVSQTEFDCGDVGANTVILTVTDINGNTNTATATVTVEDNTAPVVITQDITVQLDATGEVIITAEQIDNGSTDACGIASLSLSQTGFDCGDVGAHTVTLTVTDINGNTNTATATVTVEDSTPPVVTTQDITVQLDATGAVSITADQIDNGSSDACGIASITVSQTEFDCGDVGANTVTLTVIDVNGNINTGTATVTVEDNTDPVVLTRDITVQLDATGAVSITADQIDDGSSDVCGITMLELDRTDFTCADVGDNTVTLTVTDVNGNTNTATATVTVEDNIAPVVLTRDITVQLDATGAVSITVEQIDSGSSDACGIASLSLSQTDFNCGDVGANTVTLTVTDVNGNTNTATATVTVEDNTAPVVITQDITVQLDATGAVSITAEQIDNGSSDACGIATLELDRTDFTCADVGANTVTLTVTDVNGNTNTATATVTVEDNNSPEVVVRDITVQLGADGTVSITADQINSGSAATCGIATLELDRTDFSCADVGANTVTLTVTDVNGNTDTATATVTVEDVTAPVVSVRDITVQLDATGTASITADQIDNGSSDACGIASITVSQTDFDCGDVGANTVTLTVTDVNGNTNTATATVTVEDNTAPVALARDITVYLDASGTASITADQIDNGSSDACGIASLSLSQTNFDCGDVGANTVTLTVTDVNGNTNTATATVTVEDNTAPVVTTQDITVYLDATGAVSITADELSNGTSDACGIADIIVSQTDFDCGDVGANTVTLTVTDVNGNSATGTATVMVVDNTAPIVITQDITIQLDATGVVSITAEQIENGSSDACGIASMSLSQTDFDCGDVGANTVTLTVTDVNGNTNTATATVTVEDNTAPVALARDITVYLDATGTASITAEQIDNGSSDACGIASLSLSQTDFDCGDVGANTVTLTVTDVNGNSATGTATVTIVGNTAPVVVTRDITVELGADGTVTITADQLNNGIEASCGIASIELDRAVFTCADIGENMVTLTVTDVNGNVNTGTAKVSVEDVTPPVPDMDTLPLITVNCEINELIPPTATDNCGGQLIGTAEFSLPLTESTLVIWTFTDDSGNSITQSQQVEVEDDIAPEISGVPDDFEVILEDMEEYVLPDFTQIATATDNCTVASFIQSPDAGTVYTEAGEIEIVLIAVDGFGNEATTSFRIRITRNNRLLIRVEDPALITVPWNTPLEQLDLPETVRGILSNGQVIDLGVSWNTESYDPLQSGLYQFPGTLVLGNLQNPQHHEPILTVMVGDKLAPTDILLSETTFAANIELGTSIGTLTTVDTQDDVHVYALSQSGVHDNTYFVIVDDRLTWNSTESAAGKTAFTVTVTSTDRVGNVIERSFTLTRERVPIGQINVPNTFTPNGDGVNDTWGVPDLQFFQGGRVQVFERSGKRVFYTEDAAVRWDGTFNGEELPVGTYYWILESRETDEVRRGILNLLRR